MCFVSDQKSESQSEDDIRLLDERVIINKEEKVLTQNLRSRLTKSNKTLVSRERNQTFQRLHKLNLKVMNAVKDINEPRLTITRDSSAHRLKNQTRVNE